MPKTSKTQPARTAARAILAAAAAGFLAACQSTQPAPGDAFAQAPLPDDPNTIYAPDLTGDRPQPAITSAPRASAPPELPDAADTPRTSRIPEPVRTPARPPARTAGGDSDRLRIGDFLQVKLSGVPTEEARSDEFRINDDGSITMPHLPPVKAAGLTTGQLERQIEEMYRDRRIFSNPSVSVVPGGRFINIIGEVRVPQRIPYTNDLTLLRAIAASGGFTDYANKRSVRIQRGGEMLTVNAGAALKDPNLDEPLRAGDTIEVRRSIF